MIKIAPFLLALCLIILLGCGQINNLSTSVSRIEINPPTAVLLAYVTQEFTAKAYNASGVEVYFNPTSWALTPQYWGTITDWGRNSSGEPFADFMPLAEGTIELRAYFGGVWGVATIEAVIGTLEVLYVTPNPAAVGKDGELTFYASGEDISGHKLTAVPATWEVVGVAGTIETGPSSSVIFTAGSTPGTGIVYAYFGGVIGSSELTITGTTAEASKAATKSTFVDSSNPTSNESTLLYLQTGNTWESLVSFEVSGLSSVIITSATLEINVINAVSSSGNIQIRLYAPLGGWDEGTVTWNTMPTPGGTILGSASVFAGSSGTVSITLNSSGLAIVNGWLTGPNYGLYIRKLPTDPSYGYIQFSSTRDSPQPVLRITYKY